MALGKNFLNSIQNQDIILPYLEMSMTSDNWPDSYDVKVDTGWSGKGDTYFHPSSHIFVPERLLYYMMTGQTTVERKSLTSAMTLSVGTALHAVIETQLVMAGITTWDDVEVATQNDEKNFRGHIDLIATIDGKRYVVDIKTVYGAKWERLTEPQQEWVGQLSSYIYSQQAAGDPVEDMAIVICVQVGWPYSVREFHVKRDDILLRSTFGKWADVRESIADNEPPKKICEGCAWDNKVMSACPAKAACKETFAEAVKYGIAVGN